MEGKVIFCTGNRGPKVMHDAQGVIAKFINTKNDVIQGNEGLMRVDKKPNIWFVVLDEKEDAEKIDRVRNLRAYKSHEIWESDAEPQIGNYEQFTALVAGGPSAQKVVDRALAEQEGKFNQEKQQTQKDVARYGQLFATVCKAHGEFITGADPILVQEFKDLQIKLGIKEEKEDENPN